jgi:hypothetical protein
MEVVTLLKRSLSSYLYIALSSLFSLISSTQKWLEFNPECTYPLYLSFTFISFLPRFLSLTAHTPQAETTIMQHVMKDPSLCDFLTNHMSIVHSQTNRHIGIPSYLLLFITSYLVESLMSVDKQGEIIVKQEESIKELTLNKELAEASSAAKSQFLANMRYFNLFYILSFIAN